MPTAFVFKTVSDQYGKYSFVKVLSGSIAPDLPMVNARTGEKVKLGRLYTIRGKKNAEVKELVCGDIGAIAKMDIRTGDTLCDERKVVSLKNIPFAEPCYSVAIPPSPWSTTPKPTRWWSPARATCRWTCWSAS